MFLCATSTAGVAELVLVFMFLESVDSVQNVYREAMPDNGFIDKAVEFAMMYLWLLMGYMCFVVVFLVFAINLELLQVADDVFLVRFATFTCFLTFVNSQVFTPGKPLVKLPDSVLRSCLLLFSEFPVSSEL